MRGLNTPGTARDERRFRARDFVRKYIGTGLPALLCLLIGMLASSDRRDTPPPAAGDRSGAMQALDFWSGARSYPFGRISPDAQFRAFRNDQTLRKREAESPLSAGGWKFIGPSNLSGRMLCVAVNPLNPATIYAGSASGGLWRSHTGGTGGDWHRIGTGYPVLGVAAIAIDPTDTNRIYIGTGEVYRYNGTAGGLMVRTTRGSYGMGLLRTTDGGSSWTMSLDWSYNQERGVQMIRINPLNPSSVWAATTEGIYRSTDAGDSWTVSLPVPMGQDIVIHSSDTLRMLASTGNLGFTPFIYRTNDGGAIWYPVTPVPFSGKTLLAGFAGNPDVVYASIADSTTGVGGLWRTDNFGESWILLSDNTTNNIFGVQGWYSHFVAVHPLDSTQVFHAGVPASRSSDGGYTFTGAGGTYSDHHGYAYDPVDPSVLYVANDDGIYRSTNFGQNFTKVSDNLATGQFYAGFSNSASDSLIALGQVQDHIPGYLYQGSAYWPASAADEVGWTAIDQTDDYIMYAGTRGGGSLRKSTNRGVSWFNSSGGFSGRACWNTPFVVSPSDPSILYFGRSRVFKSTNTAGSWFATNGGNELPDGNPPISMAISATNPDTVFVGTAPLVGRTHIYRTTNGGTNWTDVTDGLPDRYPLDIAVDPVDPANVYVGYGGYGSGHVYKSADGGITWADITRDLPDIPVTALLVDPLNPDIVYLGSDIGVHISTDAGLSWLPFSEGLPEAVLVSDLTMTPSNRTLRASTHGNSVFERAMPEVLPGLALVSPSGGEVWETGQTEIISWSQTLVPEVTITYSTDDGATWIDVAASVPAWPDSFAWTVPPTLTTTARVRVVSSTDTAVHATSAGPFTITFPGIVYALSGDWNLLSVPLVVPDYSAAELFPDKLTHAYAYSGSYVPAETLVAGRGYWLKFPGPSYQPLRGDTLASDTVPVSKGWNIIGSVTPEIAAAALVTEPAGLIETPLFGYSGAYTEASTIVPGMGYWVKMSAPGLLILGDGAPATVPNPAPVAEGDILRITDAHGRSRTLRLFPGEAGDMSRFELPPVPPEGAFDVRFAGGLSAAAVEEGSVHPLLHSGISGAVRIDWDAGGGTAYLLNTDDGRAVRLAGSGTAMVSSLGDASVTRGVTAAEGLPDSPALYQNYPNPFNPETRIRFALPPREGGIRVDLSVYDPAGRLVATLIDGVYGPGIHSADWYAAHLPSGVYFCRLRTGSGTGIIKMLLMK